LRKAAERIFWGYGREVLLFKNLRNRVLRKFGLDKCLVSFVLDENRQAFSSSCKGSVFVVRIYPKPQYQIVTKNFSGIFKLQCADRQKKNGTAKQTDIILLHFITNVQKKISDTIGLHMQKHDARRQATDKKPNQQYKAVTTKQQEEFPF
jgi:hypothetical protein